MRNNAEASVHPFSITLVLIRVSWSLSQIAFDEQTGGYILDCLAKLKFELNLFAFPTFQAAPLSDFGFVLGRVQPFSNSGAAPGGGRGHGAILGGGGIDDPREHDLID